MRNFQDIERALVITAHPDDLDFGCAGTIASLVKAGTNVSYCICTDGDAGGFDPEVPRSDIPAIRQREQRNAASQLGVQADNIHFLGYPDGALQVTMDLRRDISRIIRKVRPQVVITQSPDRDYERIYASHPDHLAAGEAALCAVYPDARNPFTHTQLIDEGFTDWAVPEVWVMDNSNANQFVDISGHFDSKINALLQHVSQTEHWGEAGLRERVGEWNSELARRGGLPQGRFAEAFRVVNTE